MDIKTASDFEINKAVAESLGYVVNPKIGNNDTAFLVDPPFEIGYEGVDYCNQWQDAGPIIQNNAICLNIIEFKTTSIPLWAAGSIADHRVHLTRHHKNPMRAAMECYLMMKADEE